ncbi:hypothetical protein E2C01_056086 [Portunus trituberculatus]|uniref:Uncharacterized protein n=1 Tax=Portunus trituberculatus TaxID=210409 RepID=A0A5B7GXZ9_PORTR|nr:hypothetical protein [Portunus trituberculatus]
MTTMTQHFTTTTTTTTTTNTRPDTDKGLTPPDLESFLRVGITAETLALNRVHSELASRVQPAQRISQEWQAVRPPPLLQPRQSPLS